MDDRQTQIRAGAGLEDSRINKEFIDFLNKWSSPVILVLAIAALVWRGLIWMDQKKIEKVDNAFGSLHAATAGGNPSPASLNALADEYSGVRSVAEIAKLTTADMYLTAYLRGVQPGATINPVTGEPLEESDKLDEGQRLVYLDQAADLASDVVATTEADEGKALLTMQGLIRMGAVAECKREFDRAKAEYSRVIELAQKIDMPSLVEFGQMRLDAVDSFDPNLELPSQGDLVILPGEEAPEIPDPVEPEATETDDAAESSDSEAPAADETSGTESESEQP